ncbi:MAG TPA: PIG-L deacetylase family protein [Rhizomicrobium sp.]|nr:PIG-L deacetylase family protein [Rhizomicrobium sp.]
MTAQKNQRIAVVVAHADDEVLGCGGTLKRHTAAGDEVWTIVLADGETSRFADSPPDDFVRARIAERRAAAQRSSEALGVEHLHIHEFPDNRLDTRPLLEIVRVVEQHIHKIGPDMVYTHHSGDVNIDHRLVHEAVITACRPGPGHPVKDLLFFETPSSTEWQPAHSAQAFLPNWFVDISETLEHKLAALKHYDQEMRPWPHPRSYEGVRHLASWRGASVGCAAAEAFILGRRIRRP